MNKSLLCFAVVLCAALVRSEVTDPLEPTRRAVEKVLEAISKPTEYLKFGAWSYEGATIARGLWEIDEVYPELEIEAFLHPHLNHFEVCHVTVFRRTKRILSFTLLKFSAMSTSWATGS